MATPFENMILAGMFGDSSLTGMQSPAFSAPADQTAVPDPGAQLPELQSLPPQLRQGLLKALLESQTTAPPVPESIMQMQQNMSPKNTTESLGDMFFKGGR